MQVVFLDAATLPTALRFENRAMQGAEFKRKAEEQGAYAVYMSPQGLAGHTSKELQSWGKFVKDAKITGE